MKLNLFTDFHYCEFDAKQTQEKAQRFYLHFLDEIVKDTSNYIFCLGDLATEGNIDHYKIIKSHINKENNFINILGNHDTSFVSKKDIQDYFNSQRYFLKEIDDIAIIGLDSTKEFSPNDWGGIIDQEQLSWLDKTIDQVKNKNIIILSHHPLYNTTFNSDKDMSHIENSSELTQILSKVTKPSLFICGHVHYNSVVTNDNWTYIQMGATIDTNAYLQLNTTDTMIEVEYKTVPMDTVDKSFLNKVLHFTPNPNNLLIEKMTIQKDSFKQ